MKNETQEFVVIARPTVRGAEYIGECEECHKPVSKIWAFERRRVYVKSDGTRYLGLGAAKYGHKHCLTARFGKEINQATLVSRGHVLLAPHQQLTWKE